MRFFLFCSAINAVLLCSCECSKTVECPGFGDTLLQNWFPYPDSIVQIFTAGAQSKSFVLRNVNTTMPYQTTTGLYGGGGDCNANKMFYSGERDSANNLFFMIELLTQQPAFSSDITRSCYLTITGNRIELNDLTTEGFKIATINNVPAQVTYAAQLAIGNRIFNNVQQIQRDTSGGKITGLYELYLAKGAGVAAYRIYPDTLWIRN